MWKLYFYWYYFLLQCLNLSEEDLAVREVDFIDIVQDPIDPAKYKEEEVSISFHSEL